MSDPDHDRGNILEGLKIPDVIVVGLISLSVFFGAILLMRFLGVNSDAIYSNIIYSHDHNYSRRDKTSNTLTAVVYAWADTNGNGVRDKNFERPLSGVQYQVQFIQDNERTVCHGETRYDGFLRISTPGQSPSQIQIQPRLPRGYCAFTNNLNEYGFVPCDQESEDDSNPGNPTSQLPSTPTHPSQPLCETLPRAIFFPYLILVR